MKGLSVIIPSFNRADLLHYGLLSLSRQTFPQNYEILVLNDGVEDETREVCNRYPKLNIRYFFTGKRNKQGLLWRIPGFPINIGLKLAKFDTIILTCPEIYLTVDMIPKILETLALDDKKLVITNGVDDCKGLLLNEIKNGFFRANVFSESHKNYVPLNTEFPFFMCLKKKHIVNIGGYDEDLIGYCFDDADIVGRLLKTGCYYHKIPEVIIHLYHSRKERIGIQDKRRDWLYNQNLYEKKKEIIIRNENRTWGRFEEANYKSDKKISLILPSFKRPELLRLGLSSIYKFSPSYNVEILVLNDGIKDDTEQVCNLFKDKLNIKYIFTGQRNKNAVTLRRVPGFAINIGLKQCEGEIVILSCPEIYHLNNALDLIIEESLQNPKALVIPEFIYFDEVQTVTNKLFSLSLPELENNSIDVSTLTSGNFGYGHVIMPYLMAIHKKELIEIGGYDEDFTGYAGDDSDLISRLQKKGLKHLRTKAQAIHLYHAGTNNGDAHWENPEWCYNYKLFQDRLNIIERNKGREWGVLESE